MLSLPTEGNWPAGMRRWAIRIAGAIMALTAMAVLCYCTLRAHHLSFTHDESLSYLSYVPLGWNDLFSHKEGYTNNHMLNSMGMKVAAGLFGPGELSLRSPNLLALLLYLIYAALLVRPLGVLPGTFTYLCLCTGLNFLDSFSLARGYGLSFGFLLMAQYHLDAALRTRRSHHVWWMQVGLILGILSSFALLTIASAAVVVLCAVSGIMATSIGPSQAGWIRLLRTQALLAPLLVLAVWEPVRQTVSQNDFGFGGSTGFVADTFTSMIYSALPAIVVDEGLVEVLFIAFLVLAMVVVYAGIRWWAFQERSTASMPIALLAHGGVMFSCCLVIVVQHMILGTDYPVARFARFLYPPLVLTAGAVLSHLAERRVLYWPVVIFMGWASMVSVRTLLERGDLVGTTEWGYDANTEEIFRSIEKDMQHGTQDSVRIGHPWILGPSLAYYRSTSATDRLMPIQRVNPDYQEDYLVLADSMRVRFDSSGHRLLGHYPYAGLWVYGPQPRDN